MNHMFRKVRIAFSVVCGIACLLLIVLWVRSFWWIEIIWAPLSDEYSIAAGSFPGICGVGFPPAIGTWGIERSPGEDWWANRTDQYTSRWGALIVEPRSLLVPYWLLVLVSAFLSATPWIGWTHRFSIRTLFIATTLLSLLLGLMVLASM
jgi:hypothetical protein